MTNRKMFTLYLIENEDGQVRVISDYTGKGERCLALGVEIIEGLASITPFVHGDLPLARPQHTDAEH